MFASLAMPQQSNTTVKVLLVLSVLLAAQVLGQMGDGRPGHPYQFDSVDGSFTLRRDMAVPAPCWRAPWVAQDADVVPYYRDRLILEWPDAQALPGDTFHISKLPVP